MQPRDRFGRLVDQADAQLLRLVVIGDSGLPASLRLALVGREHVVIVQPLAIRVGRVPAAERREREIDENPIHDEHDAEKAAQHHEHVASLELLREPTLLRHRSGPWKFALCSALSVPSRSVTTKENSLDSASPSSSSSSCPRACIPALSRET